MNRVQEIRKERNITQVQLAKYAGISRKYLSNVENQLANPSVDVAFRISTALSVCLAVILINMHNRPMKPTLVRNLLGI